MRTLIMFSLIFSISTIGCALAQEYDISIKNTGNEMVYDAHILYGNFRSVGGTLPPGIRSVHMKPAYPIPEKAIVQWRSHDKVLHEKQVMVKKNIPKGFNGEIRFEIDNKNNVEVVLIE